MLKIRLNTLKEKKIKIVHKEVKLKRKIRKNLKKLLSKAIALLICLKLEMIWEKLWNQKKVRKRSDPEIYFYKKLLILLN